MVLSRQMIVEADTIEIPLPTLWGSTTGRVVTILFLWTFKVFESEFLVFA